MSASIQMIIIIVATAAAAGFATKHVVGRARDACSLAVLTIGLGLPLWTTCDHYLLKVLPTVWWFDPREPFAPYFLLYLPLSMLLAVTPELTDVARRLALDEPTPVRNPRRQIRALQLWAERFRGWSPPKPHWNPVEHWHPPIDQRLTHPETTSREIQAAVAAAILRAAANLLAARPSEHENAAVAALLDIA